MIDFISALLAKFTVSVIEGIGLFTGVILGVHFFGKLFS